MKKQVLLLVIALMASMNMMGQTYTSLWKQVSEAEQKDLPQTEMKVLRQIVDKAEAENAYGQLLKAELMEAKTQALVAPDSLAPALDRLKAREAATEDAVLKAVYNTVLGYIYENNSDLDRDHHRELAAGYYDKAMADPDALAAVKTTDYEPFVISGRDSKFFCDDMLSVIGYETKRFAALHQYYLKTTNRHAALLSALEMLKQEQPEEAVSLNKSMYLQRLDSLINAYADLDVCGEVAIERYQYMLQYTDATPEQKWQYINMALERWGNWQRMNEMRNHLRDLTALQYNVEIEQEVNIPDCEQKVEVTDMRGISQFIMRVYRVNIDGNTELDPQYSEHYKKIKPLLTPMPELTQTHSYVGKKDYELFDDSLLLAGLPVGVYMIEFESKPGTNISRSFYHVSNLRVLSQYLPDNKIRYVVVNATTGQPVKGAQLRLRLGWNDDAKWAKATTDGNGEYVYQFKDDDPREIWVFTDDDRACQTMSATGHFYYYGKKDTQHHIEIFTDREIYRPGQTVHVAAIAYKTEKGFENEVEAGKQLVAQLRDANYQTVAEKTLTTDEYGTCATDFILPSGSLNGTYSVRVGNKSLYFTVDEYKRPTFEVEFPEVNQHYEEGDTVVVRATARSYAGVPVQGARVIYKVQRKMAFWWWSYSRYWDMGVLGTGSADEQIVSGEAMTDADGHFDVEIPMELPKTRHPMFYNFVVTADVTDVAGETHQGSMTLPLGNRKTAFSTTLPNQVLAEKVPQVMFNLRNAAGIDIRTALRYRIDRGKWQEGETNTQLAELSSELAALKSGKHTIEATCETDTLKQEFVVFSLDDKRPAAETKDWFFVSDKSFNNDGTPVTVQVGSSDKNVHIVYSIIAGKEVIESGRVDQSNALINRKLTYKDEYGDGLLLCFAWIKEGVAYIHETTIRRPLPPKELTLKWQTFRNRLTPGQEEEWTLTVTAPSTEKDGKDTPANAQLMATLYDKSLDQLDAHEWNFRPYLRLNMASTAWISQRWGEIEGSGYKHLEHLAVSQLDYSHFDESLFPEIHYTRGRIGAIPNHQLYLSAADMDEFATEEKAAAVDMDAPIAGMKVRETGGLGPDAEEAAPAEEETPQTEQVQARENLNETAFFYPQLTTDSLGQVRITFTLPECLTTWRFIGLAHTKDMMYGLLTDEAVAKKDVMIQPNIPRFVRQGDKATISARIFNTSDKAITGTARMELIDPETEKVIAQMAKPVSLQADTTTSVTFDCQPREQWGTLLIAKVTVSGKDFSDGEQHYLPILPNRERVTVTVPFTQNEPGIKDISLADIVPATEAANAKLTVEYTNNPAWLMIQALPTMSNPSDDNAISLAAAFYANTLGLHILNQNPNAKNVFKMWTQEQGEETSLMSNLQKDRELKDLLLNETPWVMDAEDEADQKRQLAEFFDTNLMQQRLQTNVYKLQKLQLGDGSWSWWKGMSGSFWMTVEISEMLVRLNQMADNQEETEEMLSGAFDYMGKTIVKMVDEMKKEEKKGFKQVFPSHKALQWLYICTLDGRTLSKKVQEANDYLCNLLKKETKNQTMYEKAMTAIVLNAKTYIKSLKEYTVYKEEMGRYYDTPRASYSWRDYRIPTQVAAIEAIQRLTPEDTQTIDEMRRWLLQEKRTQAWDTPINSTDAVYAFLNGKAETLKAQENTYLKVDGKALELPKATAGIGYVKTTIDARNAKTLTAEKVSMGTSWGAVYAQFMQPTADIKDQQSGISVKRELLTDQPTLKVGQRVKVRLTIEADRDYDFVQVTDKRAACLEPVNQLSGYHWGYYCSPKDNTTNYYFDVLSKGKHVIETEYYVDRAGTYQTGTCTVSCAYAPEFRGLTGSQTIEVKGDK